MPEDTQDNQIKCTECNGNTVLSNGSYVCANCGLVVMPEYVDPNYQLAEPAETDRRPKAYTALGERLSIVDGLGSYIDYPNKHFFSDIRGSSLNEKNQALFKRLKYQYSNRLRRGTVETDYRVFKILNHVTAHLGISKEIRDRAAYFYRKIRSMSEKKYTNSVLLIAVCLVTAIRENGTKAPRTITEIAGVFTDLGHRVTTRSIVREMLKLRMELNLRQKKRESQDYIYRIISDVVEHKTVKLRIEQLKEDPSWYRRVLTTRSLELYGRGIEEEIGGRNPYIFAVSIVYGVDKQIGHERKRKSILTQHLISQITNVAEFSIRDHFCSVLKPKIMKKG